MMALAELAGLFCVTKHLLMTSFSPFMPGIYGEPAVLHDGNNSKQARKKKNPSMTITNNNHARCVTKFIRDALGS